MATQLIQGFDPRTNDPIDSRLIVAGTAERLAIREYDSYIGMFVYQTDENRYYVLQSIADGTEAAWKILDQSGDELPAADDSFSGNIFHKLTDSAGGTIGVYSYDGVTWIQVGDVSTPPVDIGNYVSSLGLPNDPTPGRLTYDSSASTTNGRAVWTFSSEAIAQQVEEYINRASDAGNRLIYRAPAITGGPLNQTVEAGFGSRATRVGSTVAIVFTGDASTISFGAISTGLEVQFESFDEKIGNVKLEGGVDVVIRRVGSANTFIVDSPRRRFAGDGDTNLLSGISTWAAGDNTDAIPASKLSDAPFAVWAGVDNTDAIPGSKLTEAPFVPPPDRTIDSGTVLPGGFFISHGGLYYNDSGVNQEVGNADNGVFDLDLFTNVSSGQYYEYPSTGADAVLEIPVGGIVANGGDMFNIDQELYVWAGDARAFAAGTLIHASIGSFSNSAELVRVDGGGAADLNRLNQIGDVDNSVDPTLPANEGMVLSVGPSGRFILGAADTTSVSTTRTISGNGSPAQPLGVVLSNDASNSTIIGSDGGVFSSSLAGSPARASVEFVGDSRDTAAGLSATIDLSGEFANTPISFTGNIRIGRAPGNFGSRDDLVNDPIRGIFGTNQPTTGFVRGDFPVGPDGINLILEDTGINAEIRVGSGITSIGIQTRGAAGSNENRLYTVLGSVNTYLVRASSNGINLDGFAGDNTDIFNLNWYWVKISNLDGSPRVSSTLVPSVIDRAQLTFLGRRTGGGNTAPVSFSGVNNSNFGGATLPVSGAGEQTLIVDGVSSAIRVTVFLNNIAAPSYTWTITDVSTDITAAQRAARSTTNAGTPYVPAAETSLQDVINTIGAQIVQASLEPRRGSPPEAWAYDPVLRRISILSTDPNSRITNEYVVSITQTSTNVRPFGDFDLGVIFQSSENVATDSLRIVYRLDASAVDIDESFTIPSGSTSEEIARILASSIPSSDIVVDVDPQNADRIIVQSIVNQPHPLSGVAGSLVDWLEVDITNMIDVFTTAAGFTVGVNTINLVNSENIVIGDSFQYLGQHYDIAANDTTTNIITVRPALLSAIPAVSTLLTISKTPEVSATIFGLGNRGTSPLTLVSSDNSVDVSVSTVSSLINGIEVERTEGFDLRAPQGKEYQSNRSYEIGDIVTYRETSADDFLSYVAVRDQTQERSQIEFLNVDISTPTTPEGEVSRFSFDSVSDTRTFLASAGVPDAADEAMTSYTYTVPTPAPFFVTEVIDSIGEANIALSAGDIITSNINESNVSIRRASSTDLLFVDADATGVRLSIEFTISATSGIPGSISAGGAHWALIGGEDESLINIIGTTLGDSLVVSDSDAYTTAAGASFDATYNLSSGSFRVVLGTDPRTIDMEFSEANPTRVQLNGFPDSTDGDISILITSVTPLVIGPTTLFELEGVNTNVDFGNWAVRNSNVSEFNADGESEYYFNANRFGLQAIPRVPGLIYFVEINSNVAYNSVTGQLDVGGSVAGALTRIGQLSDVPSTFGTEDQVLAVNAARDGLEYVDFPTGNIPEWLNDVAYVSNSGGAEEVIYNNNFYIRRNTDAPEITGLTTIVGSVGNGEGVGLLPNSFRFAQLRRRNALPGGTGTGTLFLELTWNLPGLGDSVPVDNAETYQFYIATSGGVLRATVLGTAFAVGIFSPNTWVITIQNDDGSIPAGVTFIGPPELPALAGSYPAERGEVFAYQGLVRPNEYPTNDPNWIELSIEAFGPTRYELHSNQEVFWSELAETDTETSIEPLHARRTNYQGIIRSMEVVNREATVIEVIPGTTTPSGYIIITNTLVPGAVSLTTDFAARVKADPSIRIVASTDTAPGFLVGQYATNQVSPAGSLVGAGHAASLDASTLAQTIRVKIVNTITDSQNIAGPIGENNVNAIALTNQVFDEVQIAYLYDTVDRDVSVTGSALTIQDEGIDLATAADTIDFVGAGVEVTGTGATKTVTIAGNEDSIEMTFGQTVQTSNFNFRAESHLDVSLTLPAGINTESISSITVGTLGTFTPTIVGDPAGAGTSTTGLFLDGVRSFTAGTSGITFTYNLREDATTADNLVGDGDPPFVTITYREAVDSLIFGSDFAINDDGVLVVNDTPEVITTLSEVDASEERVFYLGFQRVTAAQHQLQLDVIDDANNPFDNDVIRNLFIGFGDTTLATLPPVGGPVPVGYARTFTTTTDIRVTYPSSSQPTVVYPTGTVLNISRDGSRPVSFLNITGTADFVTPDGSSFDYESGPAGQMRISSETIATLSGHIEIEGGTDIDVDFDSANNTITVNYDGAGFEASINTPNSETINGTDVVSAGGGQLFVPVTNLPADVTLANIEYVSITPESSGLSSVFTPTTVGEIAGTGTGEFFIGVENYDVLAFNPATSVVGRGILFNYNDVSEANNALGRLAAAGSIIVTVVSPDTITSPLTFGNEFILGTGGEIEVSGELELNPNLLLAGFPLSAKMSIFFGIRGDDITSTYTGNTDSFTGEIYTTNSIDYYYWPLLRRVGTSFTPTGGNLGVFSTEIDLNSNTNTFLNLIG